MVLTLRRLNRTLLQRQHLLERSTTLSALQMVGHLLAMQSQEPNWPYIGLWTRLANFTHADLTALLDDRMVVRSTMIRTTQHLATAELFATLRPVVQPALDRTARARYFTDQTTDLNLAELLQAGRELLTGRTLTRRQYGTLLAERFPGRKASILAAAVELRTPIVHPNPGGTWGGWGTRPGMPVALAEDWLGRPLDGTPRTDEVITRYLAAFGPATVKDIQSWSGLTRLCETVERLDLRILHDEQGKQFVDLPGAPLADPDLPAPVRFLPAFDNLLLGHADRTRIISDAARKVVMPGGAMVLPTFLIDGFVHGTWSAKGKNLRLTPLKPLPDKAASALLEEAERLRPFIGAETLTLDREPAPSS
ncbi:winged helix DNA-binding domain-containing protein [Nonomuraea sp. NPDC046570]|uniref:winged helix DNA-binding domain-containing protein n=1 Tax=Nonomuraea sp. NPDC046570 TaxID=3155255 RepID=UPI0033C58EC8